MRRNRVWGVVVSSVAALGLTALAVTSANAADSGESTPAERPTGYQSAEPAVGDGGAPAEKPAGIRVERTEDGMSVSALTPDEIEAGDGWRPAG